MSTQLEQKDLANTQQMEVAVNGPDGATHLILCTGIANLGTTSQETYTFLVGPRLSRRQFVAVIASGALAKIQYCDAKSPVKTSREASLLSLTGEYDDESGQVKIMASVILGAAWSEVAISYHASILAELAAY